MREEQVEELRHELQKAKDEAAHYYCQMRNLDRMAAHLMRRLDSLEKGRAA